MFQKRDLVLIALVLCVAAATYGLTLLARSGQTLSNNVNIWIGNDLYRSVSLGMAQTISIVQENGERNVIEINEKGARMVESTCQNQLCVQQGWVTVANWLHRSLGRSVICLPNRVRVELAVKDADQMQQVLDLPDV